MNKSRTTQDELERVTAFLEQKRCDNTLMHEELKGLIKMQTRLPLLQKIAANADIICQGEEWLMLQWLAICNQQRKRDGK